MKTFIPKSRTLSEMKIGSAISAETTAAHLARVAVEDHGGGPGDERRDHGGDPRAESDHMSGRP
jgi:hypothetical protein